MKKGILMIILLLIVSNVVWAQKAPDGFLGIKWGTTREEFIKIVKPTFDGCPANLDEALQKKSNFLHLKPKEYEYTNFYACGQWEKIGDALVTRYWFYFSKWNTPVAESSHLTKDEFYSVKIKFPKGDSFDVFLRALTEKYGKPGYVEPLVLRINPKAKVGMTYGWTVENKVSILLEYNDMEEAGINGSLQYTYLPIWNQIHKPKDTKKTKDKL